jgi:hypothetical protein
LDLRSKSIDKTFDLRNAEAGHPDVESQINLEQALGTRRKLNQFEKLPIAS